jgi:hypothetical protein
MMRVLLAGKGKPHVNIRENQAHRYLRW